MMRMWSRMMNRRNKKSHKMIELLFKTSFFIFQSNSGGNFAISLIN